MEQGQQVVDDIKMAGGQAAFIQGDVADESVCKRLVDATVATFGRIDILFNNAGVTTTIPLEEATEAEFDRVMGANVKGIFFCCKYAIPYMKRQGSGVILTTSSRAAYVSAYTQPLYAASKAAALQLTQAIGIDYASSHIRACSLLPGMIRTRMMERVEQGASDPEAVRQWHEHAQPIGRTGTPEEVAYAALFLVSDEASFVTATPLLVDGGYVFS